MALTAPSVRGPISECSSRVRVEGQVPGAEIEVIVDGSVRDRITAGSAREVVSLSGSLSAGQEVAARQRVGGTTSEVTPDPVEVQRKPDPVGPVSFAAPVLDCAECVRVAGAVPGADVEVSDGGGRLGGGHALFGGSHVGLRPHVPPGDRVTARQTACGEDGAPVEVDPEPVITDAQELGLPTPEVHRPLKACRHVVPVSGVVPGARVTIHRSKSADPTFCVGRADVRWNVHLGTPLKENEVITASQALPACDLASRESDPVEVGPPEPVDPTGVAEPLCAGGETVSVTGLDEGAEVEIAVEVPSSGASPPSRTVYRGGAPEQGTHEFHVDPLPPRAEVSARQTVCGLPSGWSGTVTASARTEQLDTPEIPGPLFECATVVHVTDLTPGTWVYVESADLDGTIGKEWVTDTDATVEVAPQLAAGDEITARTVGCGEESAESGSEPVNDLDELGPPTVVEPVYNCHRPVRVTDVVPGAAVDVYVDGIWAGTTVAGEDTVAVTVPASRLTIPGEVTARQRLCGRVSDESEPPVSIEDFAGEWTVVGGKNKSEILAIHAVLLPTGKVMYFGGDQHDREPHENDDVDHTRVYDPDTGKITSVSGLTTDVFCAGHALLEDGNLVTGGGTAGWNAEDHFFLGSKASWLFKPKGGDWDSVSELVWDDSPGDLVEGDQDGGGGRWYPALVTLADGRVLALGGEPNGPDTRDVNNTLELYDPSTKSWNRVGSTDYPEIPGVDQLDKRDSEYMRLHVLPDESVLCVSEMEDETEMDSGSLKKWNPYGDPTDWDLVRAAGMPSQYSASNTDPQNYTTALLPLRPDENWQPEVLIAGLPNTYVLDPDAGSMDRVSRDLSGSPVRNYGVATLLPTGEIALTGGVDRDRDRSCPEKKPDEDNATKEVELFDPEDYRANRKAWRTGPAAEVVRDYHSVALLLADGAVWTAGSNNYGCHGGETVREHRIERYEPWYFCEDRPVIDAVDDRACHGESLTIRTPDADAIERVAIVRCGSVTHSWNFDQRHVTLPHDVTGAKELVASVPSNPAIAVPGYYLLFVLTADRVPSTGEFVQICTAPTMTTPDRSWWIDLIDWDAVSEVPDRLAVQQELATSTGTGAVRFDVGEKPGVGEYCCTSCEWAVTLDDPSDRLPPCGNCPKGQQTTYRRC